ncbi:MATE family efflux transporter [Halopenitus persicus]|uniref:Multidrug-efflux transporter n=1 Tax=Halopenitus persicus TaxID=1048396 RepID=A0A1H3ILD3_9EURY|nr:putative efflux protein, MATE family [Halopenitus persicus]
MTAGPIAPGLFTLAWPLVLGNLLQTLYNLADMFWVGRVSPEAVAAVSLMFPLSWMFVSTAMGVTAATIALVSQHVGAGNDRQADRIVAQTCLLATVVSVVLAVTGFLGRHWLLYWIGARGQVLVESLAYIEVILAALPLTFLFFAFRASLQGAGDTKTAMWLVAASAGLNIVIDPFLVLGWGPAPAMGTRGAAVATFISRLFAAAIGIYVLVRGDWGVQLHPRDLRPDPAILRRLVDVGYPATLDGWARSFAAVAMAALVARFGPVATAAYGIGVRLMSVSWTVSGAVGQATATGVGQNLGAGTPDRAHRVTIVATAATMALLAVAGGVVWLLPGAAVGAFIDDPAVIAEGVVFLRVIALSWAFFGGLMVLQGAFRGAGDTRIAMVLSLLSRWIFRIPLAAVLAFGTVTIPVIGLTYTGLNWGVVGLWWGYAAAAVVSFGIGLAWFLRGTWREGVLEGENGSDAAEADVVPIDDD